MIDRASADDARNAQSIAEADMIYFGGGGSAQTAVHILADTRVMVALQNALQRGVPIVATSGSTVLLGERMEVITPELGAEIGRVW